MASRLFLRKHKRNPSFFKVLIQDFSTHVRIPPAFMKEFGKDVPEKTTLETYNGKSWEVGVGKLGNKFYFKNGWDKFVRANSLENGDFLVLKYFADHSKFKVKIYGKTCCEKHLINVVTVERSSNKPLNGKQDQRNEQERRKRKRNKEEKEDDDDVKKDVIKLDPDSSSCFDDDDDDDEQETGGSQKRQAESGEFKMNKKYGRVPTDHHNHITFKSENDNPFFQVQLGYSTANFYLHIPKGFFEEQMKEKKRMKLEVSERTWDLEINVYGDERRTKRSQDARVTKGWNRLAKEHHLKMGDICIFEMINPSYDDDSDNPSAVFLVHVYRWDHKEAEFSKII